MRLVFPVFILSALFLQSCRDDGGRQSNKPGPGKEQMAELNSWLVQKDRERIESYIERKGLTMKESASGLWYSVTKPGEGMLFREADKVIFDYNCYLLDGTPCYSSEKEGPREVVLGRSELEPGLNEGLKMLKPGAEATFILPPFLAYGIPGDNRAIPPRAIIVYEIRIRK